MTKLDIHDIAGLTRYAIAIGSIEGRNRSAASRGTTRGVGRARRRRESHLCGGHVLAPNTMHDALVWSAT